SPHPPATLGTRMCWRPRPRPAGPLPTRPRLGCSASRRSASRSSCSACAVRSTSRDARKPEVTSVYMTTAADPLTDPELLETAWDLSRLVDGEGRPGAERMLEEGRDRSSKFAATYAGKVADLDAAGLGAAMHELEEINELIGRAGSYASLQFSTDTADPER